MHLHQGIHFHFQNACNSYFCWGYVRSNAHQILSATAEHVTLALSAIILGFVLAVPMAVFARRGIKARGSVFTLASALYAVPSLAFVVAVYGIFGLHAITVIIPLACYSLVILVRNILTGLDEVPAEAVDAATGMGMGPARLFWKVRLPLAMPAIVAGLRLATVSTIELVVIGGYVGLGGYGKYLFDGLNRQYKPEVMTYLILTILLALVADLLILVLARPFTRWRRVAA